MARLIYLVTFVLLSYWSTAQTNTKDYCEDISRSVDDYTDVISISSPFFEKDEFVKLMFMKSIDKAKVTFKMTMTAFSKPAEWNGVGVNILFTDGTKWNNTKPEGLTTSHTYMTSFSLSAAEIVLFSTKQIKKYRLSVHEMDLTPEDATRFQNYAKCVMATK